MRVVGIGPGNPLDRTRRAEMAIRASDVIVGYARYLESIADLTEGRECISSGMTQEVDRCRAALDRVHAGRTVALVSSGDPGVYGMAGLALEMAARDGRTVPLEVIPGVSAANAAAARLGAPLMLDYAVISLSDLLVPWDVIRARLEAVAACDLVVALYNPRSKKRVRPFREACAILARHRRPETPVGIGTAVGTEDERILVSDLGNLPHLPADDIDMRSVVIVGNGSTQMLGPWLVTPRGYRL